jgi:CBS domain-containing protein
VATTPEPTVSDVMLSRPKTLPADVTVGAAQKAFESSSVKMLLLVEGERFSGAVTTIPADASPDEPAMRYVDESLPAATADMPVSSALALLDSRPNGRLVVLDGDELVGLVCLASDGATFCGSPRR